MMEKTTFLRFKEQIYQLLLKFREQTYERLSKVCLDLKDQLAQLSNLQFDEICDHVCKACPRNLLLKARLAGQGLMPIHLVRNRGITARTWLRFPKETKRALSNPRSTIQIQERGMVQDVRVESMTTGQMQKVHSGRHPEMGLIPASEQGQGKFPYDPDYFDLRTYHVEGDRVVMSFAQKKASFKGVVSLDKLEEILEAGRANTR